MHRIPQRDDLYAHEVFSEPPFDGVLVSKAIVDGVAGSAGKYSLAQRHRLRRMGVRAYLRLDKRPGSRRLRTMGDCGAFSYVREQAPPFEVDDVLQFYVRSGFDLGVSVDHVILPYLPTNEEVLAECCARQQLTLTLAAEFLKGHRQQKCGFVPLGVAQGWSPESYAAAVAALQRMGYRRIAVGGMVPLKTGDVLASLEAINAVRLPATQLHLLGITRCEHVQRFQSYGVTSFDSTMPLLQAFKDARDNYHTLEGNYIAVRVPQVEGNPSLKRRIAAGQIDQTMARRLERASLEALRAYDRDEVTVDDALSPLLEYERLHDHKADRSEGYRRVLENRPWNECTCEVCRHLGIEVVIYRGAERNRRRGFHNLTVLYSRLRSGLAWPALDGDRVVLQSTEANG